MSSGKDPTMVSETLPLADMTETDDRRRLGDPYASSETERMARLDKILRTAPHVMTILETVRALDLPDAWLVSGGIYQTAWNVLTGRTLMHGIKDFDIVYFDGKDPSYEAEDRIIHRVNAALPELAKLLEVRNQARVHLWYEKRFGRRYRPLHCAMDSLTTYAARTHAVAARLTASGEIVLHAPFGLANLFAMRLVPNYVQPNERTYVEKAERMKALWPELSVAPWGADI
ncbi:nucleotidyltransferase family protein [Labrenzia sp. VG12]|uniref:nucleotidyltransferase family protein n=1 Tax=Labrenzia sp. VG12 TaxID=2021862 RepID=UPI001AD8AE90|nr:nucleotidyltransferase family protein [Labrenzia sp. VG12]